MGIRKAFNKVTYQSNLIMHQIPNIRPSLTSVVYQQQVVHSVNKKDRKQQDPQNLATMTIDMLTT